jgi:hypothetical protein
MFYEIEKDNFINLELVTRIGLSEAGTPQGAIHVGGTAIAVGENLEIYIDVGSARVRIAGGRKRFNEILAALSVATGAPSALEDDDIFTVMQRGGWLPRNGVRDEFTGSFYHFTISKSAPPALVERYLARKSGYGMARYRIVSQDDKGISYKMFVPEKMRHRYTARVFPEIALEAYSDLMKPCDDSLESCRDCKRSSCPIGQRNDAQKYKDALVEFGYLENDDDDFTLYQAMLTQSD